MCADKEQVYCSTALVVFLYSLITSLLSWSYKVTLRVGGASNLRVGGATRGLQRVFQVLEREVLWQCLGNFVGNYCRHRRGASVKDEAAAWVLRGNMRVKAVRSFLCNLS